MPSVSRLTGLYLWKHILVLSFLFLITFAETSHGQDPWIPDSAYFVQPEFSLRGCSGQVECRLRVRLYVDGWATASAYICKIQASPNVQFDTGFAYTMPDVDCDDIYSAGFRYPATNQFSLGVVCNNLGSVIPFDGIAFEYVILAQRGDTFQVQLEKISDILIGFPINWWHPSYIDLSRTIIVPNDFVVGPGDCNCSGNVNISDAVYLIQYIFGGGPAPNPLEVADVDASCAISISDAVYMISYIFNGGPAPLPGCAKD